MCLYNFVNGINAETTEFAILVAYQWQGKGLGNKFMDLTIQNAEKRNIKKVCATVLKACVTMFQMFRKRGFAILNDDNESSYAEKILKTDKQVALVLRITDFHLEPV